MQTSNSIQNNYYPQIRNLSLRQLKEIIEEIYRSKSIYDKKYIDQQLPLETMEQHMYTYLNQKYGLKNLIVEWAGAIINGIKNYGNEDNDISVFGKILRNECDEEFRFVQIQIKNTITELLKVIQIYIYIYIYKYIYIYIYLYLYLYLYIQQNLDVCKKQISIKKIYRNYLNSLTKQNSFISKKEAVEIIQYMYNIQESEKLIFKIYTLLLNNKRK
ncbi:hypothetical protein IMG5_038510 [Ichthyophthirius multifiliis]|uniref:Uncharacterized protein n=1 Tax=Ichthyophthirius multifiliis TaxID=5932 RepID=G0QLY1_ICHMU|nr:hypothetical protein IMG5_038510 [Ichthyophthirius multifiliis]EGR33776.1 hypothetical protein IMG5_038510 [Ichthyophthirius multifiliis]|eukprot:XP_004039000.1 hypothetical protein IMG5_038510 [Ichthyophthirius multifiliis]